MSSERSKRRRVQKDANLLLAEINQSTNNSTNFCSVSSLSNNSASVNTFNNHNREPSSVPDFDLQQFNLDEASDEQMEEQNELGNDIRSQLGTWVVRHNITHKALDDFLLILQPQITSATLPRNSRTLLKTPTTYTINKICGGEFHYFSLKRFLERITENDFHPNFSSNILSIAIGVDGVPISRRRNRQFWPILISFDDIGDQSPYLVGLFYGTSKPNNVSDFLNPLVTEFIEINNTGVIVGNRLIKLKVRCVVADAPARSFLKCKVPYNAYHGCERCSVKGKFKGRVIFRDLNAPKRTDDSFVHQSDNIPHNGVSPLLELGVGLVCSVVLDYMHLICLGVMRKLLLTWYKGPLPFKLSHHHICIISKRLVSAKKFIPYEFNRKPRPIFELANWKATELRTFLLYLGPVLLHSVLDDRKYKHFLKLSVAIRILLAGNSEWYAYARELLISFVVDIPVLYSKEFLVYNVHSVIHLVDDVERFGSLDLISAFKFENYMQCLKKMIRKHNNELSQVIRRVYERDNAEEGFKRKPENKRCKISQFQKPGNDCFLLSNGTIVKITGVEKNCVKYKEFKEKQEISWLFLSSSKLGIFKVGKLSTNESSCDFSFVLRKLMLLPYNLDGPCNEFICFPLCGSDL